MTILQIVIVIFSIILFINIYSKNTVKGKISKYDKKKNESIVKSSLLINNIINGKKNKKISNEDEYLIDYDKSNLEGYGKSGLYTPFQPGQIKPKDERDTDPDTYIRRRLLFGNGLTTYDEGVEVFGKPIEESMNRVELDSYRDDFFAFRNVINQTSNDIDMVDKMNEVETSGGLTNNFKGEKIGDVFDLFTRSHDYLKKDTPFENNIRYEQQIKSGHNGMYHSKNMWNYANDNVNTGGKAFYNGIYGYDGEVATSYIKLDDFA